MPATDAEILAALAPVLAVRHLLTADGITCGTAGQLAGVEFTAERVTCPDCLRTMEPARVPAVERSGRVGSGPARVLFGD